MNVRFSYLKEKFSKPNAYRIFDKIWEEVVSTGDFTLGKSVKEFEETFAKLMGVKYAIGVANGTDALELCLWANGVRAGDEVIVPANTFVASLGAVGNLQATPVLVDIGKDYVIDPDKIEEAITPKTAAIMPVAFCGNPVNMTRIQEIATKHGIKVVVDACQAYMSSWDNVCMGASGDCGAFSLHPLKILNVWGDGGVITTNSKSLYDELKLLQNHGLQDRDTITRFPCRNSRLDSIHAVVANMQLGDTPYNVARRRTNAEYYDTNLKGAVHIIDRDPRAKSVYHLYFIEVNKDIRDQLYNYLIEHGIEAKIHYKTPLYLQPGLKELGYKKGDFIMADYLCDRIITLPVDELVTTEMQSFVIDKIKAFMGSEEHAFYKEGGDNAL